MTLSYQLSFYCLLNSRAMVYSQNWYRETVGNHPGSSLWFYPACKISNIS